MHLLLALVFAENVKVSMTLKNEYSQEKVRIGSETALRIRGYIFGHITT